MSDSESDASVNWRTAEEVAERIMHKCAEHAFVSAECAADPEHPCVIIWSESAKEHMAAMIQEYANKELSFER